MIRTTLAFALLAGAALAGCQEAALSPGAEAQAVKETDSYASHFDRPGQRYDEKARAVDSEDYLIDRAGRRIGGKGYWTRGDRDDVLPAGTRVDASGHPVETPPSRPFGPPLE